MEFLSYLKGYKTFIFNTLIAIASLAEYADLINVISPENAPLIASLIGLVNLVLRWGTDTGIFQKK